MANPKIVTSAEQPINSDGAVSTITGDEGDLVALDSNGELIAADADSGTAEPAVGVLAVPVVDPSTFPGGKYEFVDKERESRELQINDNKAPYVRGGVIVENQDADWSFSPGEPVYLAVGGGFTQTEPTGTGEIQQVLGVAHEAEQVMLDIDPDYDTA